MVGRILRDCLMSNLFFVHACYLIENQSLFGTATACPTGVDFHRGVSAFCFEDKNNMFGVFSSILQAMLLSAPLQRSRSLIGSESATTTRFTLDSHIPGGSPLKYCNESLPTDLYSIENIELYPSPLHMYFDLLFRPISSVTDNSIPKATMF